MDKETFFKSYPLKTAEHKLPDGKKLPIHELSSEQRAVLRDLAKQENDKIANAHIVVMGCDLFGEENVPQLAKMSGTVINGIADAILTLSGLGEKSKEEAKNA